jgi:hypothetical protein
MQLLALGLVELACEYAGSVLAELVVALLKTQLAPEDSE